MYAWAAFAAWGIRINRIEIVDISPPVQILQAMALQKQADQEKRARILQSEGQQQSAVNIADGNRQAAIKQAEGERQAHPSRRRQPAGGDPGGRGSRPGDLDRVRLDQSRRAGPDPGRDPPARHPHEVRREPQRQAVVPAETSGLLERRRCFAVLGDAPGLEPPTIVAVPPSSS